MSLLAEDRGHRYFGMAVGGHRWHDMILPSCNMKGCPEQRAGAEGARPGADVSVAHMPLGNIPLTFYLLSAPRLFTSFLPESHNFRNEKNPPQMEDWKADHVATRSRSRCITRSKCGWQTISVDVYAICSRSLHVSAPKSCFCTV